LKPLISTYWLQFVAFNGDQCWHRWSSWHRWSCCWHRWL